MAPVAPVTSSVPAVARITRARLALRTTMRSDHALQATPPVEHGGWDPLGDVEDLTKKMWGVMSSPDFTKPFFLYWFMTGGVEHPRHSVMKTETSMVPSQ